MAGHLTHPTRSCGCPSGSLPPARTAPAVRFVGRGNVAPTGVGGAFAVHIADVEVDPDTGKVDVIRYTALQDAGKAIHPSYVEGQIQGGAVQGIGWALNEEYVFDDNGGMLNPTFLDYRMPTSLDLPMIDTVVVEGSESWASLRCPRRR